MRGDAALRGVFSTALSQLPELPIHDEQETRMNIAVSACLLGTKCRYDGSAKPCPSVMELKSRHTLVPICPEVAAGLSIPHAPNEIASMKPLCVRDSEGADNTKAFVHGAEKSVERALSKGCELAILKAKSPSCGPGLIYDGTFSGTLVAGDGVACALFKQAGIAVVDENHIPESL